MSSYLTLGKPGEERFTEKKSIFIGSAAPVDDEAAALAFLGEIKSRYPDAKHHVYAYLCGDHDQYQRFSDAGEPAGTGGRPVLEVLKNQDLHNAVVVVTRYFGGILLGTGGLSRAYGKAASLAVESAGLVRMVLCREISFTVDYLLYGRVQNFLQTQDIRVDNTVFTDQVQVICQVEREEMILLENFLRELCRGKAEIVTGEEHYLPNSMGVS